MGEGKLSFTAEQEAAIKHRGGALLVSAAAGSGKTRVLVERLLSRIEEGNDIDEFLVITYTRAAAAELRIRIYDEIMARLANAPENRRLRRQSMLCRGASIDTIHGFCTDILRENAHLANLPPDFRVIDESEGDMIKAEILDEILNDAYETIDTSEGFRVLIDTISAGRDDKRLVRIILDAHAKLQSNPDPQGWTEEQIKMLPLDNITDISETIWGVQLMDKTRRTVRFWLEEMTKVREIMQTLPDFDKAYSKSIEATISDIDSFLTALDNGWDEARNQSDINFSRVKPKPISGYDDLKDTRLRCKNAIKKCASLFECSSQEHIEDMRAVAPAMTTLLQLVQDFDRAYSEEKRRRGVVDFSDLEHLALSLLIDGKTGKRTELAKAISRRFKEIMVDEYQDVNAVQEYIFNAVSQDSKNIFMVGDVKQSIYRFRLADPSIFLEKYRRFSTLRDRGNVECGGRNSEFGIRNSELLKDKDSRDEGGKRDEKTETDASGKSDEKAETDASGKSDKKAEIDVMGQGTKILLSKNFRSRAGVLDAVNFVFSKIMSVEFGEMDYTEDERLIPGRQDEPALGDETALSKAVELDIIDMSSLEQDEDEENPARAQVEARFIAERISELTNGQYMIPDGQGGMRHIKYSDIVILLRSMRGKAWQYAAALTERDISVDMPSDEGFLEIVEISAVLSLLSVIDNPMQDIPLAATLRGPAYEFTDDELASIRARSRDTDFYGALIKTANSWGKTDDDTRQGKSYESDNISIEDSSGDIYVRNPSAAISLEESSAKIPLENTSDGISQDNSNVDNKLAQKCATFLSEIEALREVMPDMPADRFIWHVYNKTGLFGRIGAMHGGDKRRKNLILLAEYASGFEQSGYKGLFGFLTYIRGLQERGAELVKGSTEPTSASAPLDAVRIMSIHKSKGLEFPVVILADTSKRINNIDAQQPLVLHPELGAGPMRIDRQRRIEYTTLSRMAIQSKLTSEMMAEELRLLYVAMTRAREKLIITATYKDAEKEIEKLSMISRGSIAPQVLEEIRNMAGWILIPALSGEWKVESGKWKVESGELNATDGQQMTCRGQYDKKLFDARIIPATLDGLDSQQVSEKHAAAPQSKTLKTARDKDVELLRERFSFCYPHPKAPELPSKLTVTGLKGQYIDPETVILYPEPSDNSETPVETTIHYYVSQDNSEFGIRNSEFPQETVLPHRERSDNSVSQFRRPVFIAKKTGLTAAERGTALHLAMQYIGFSKCVNTNEINDSGKIENIANVNMVNEELQRLAKKGLLTEEQAAAVDAQKITRFLKSDLGKRVLKAKDVKREFKFSLLCPAEQFYQGGGVDKILLQGVVDCFFEEDDALIVVDFKTDHVARDMLEEKTNHYTPQLATYSDALERITGKHVKDSIIYFFALDEAVTVTTKL